MDKELWAEMMLDEKATIYGRGVWHYVIKTSIGDIHVVEYENKRMSLETKIIPWESTKAVKAFKKACNDILNGVI